MLELKDLSIKFGKKEIFKDVNVSFENGVITGIKGESGSGKSTLLNVLGLIKTPDAGQYFYNGKVVNFSDENETSLFRMNNIGFIFQQGNLLNNLTVLENVMVPRLICDKNEKKTKKEAEKWLDYVNLRDQQDSYPNKLSGGEEQRVTIARALINECDIILADEPTASLDEKNSTNVMMLLSKLAHELNKIVIVVSHDNDTLNYCDRILKIENNSLVEIKSTKKHGESKEASAKKKYLGSFISNYNRMRKKESIANTVLILITAFIVSIAALSFDFGDSFVDTQKDFINSISDRSLLAINDTMGIDAIADYEEAYSFDREIIDYVKGIPGVEKVYEYYEFTSYGQDVDEDSTANIAIFDGDKCIYQKNYGNEFISNENEFCIAPKYEEENIKGYLVENSAEVLEENQVYITTSFAKEFTDNPVELIGKKIVIDCFVPGKMCNSTAYHEQKEVNIDYNITSLVTLEKSIAGVLDISYRNEKKDNKGRLILMSNNEMEEVLAQNVLSTEERTFADFEEKELAPSTLVIFADNYDETPNIEKKIISKSPTVNVINKSADIMETTRNLNGIKNTMLIIAVVLVAIVTVLFALLYYYKNRERKQEIGILKSLGLSKNDTLKLIASDLINNTIYTFIISIGCCVVLRFLVNNVFGFECVSINAVSISIAFAITLISVMLSGILSVVRTSSIDIIEAIQNNK